MRTFSQLVGSTASTSAVSYPASFTTLSSNNSAENVALGKQLVNDQNRQLIEKFFDNERTSTATTIGPQTLTFTVAPSAGDTSATLTVAWAYASCSQFVNFSSGEQRMVKFIKGSTAVTWQSGLTSAETVTASSVGVRDYPVAANISKIKNPTITVGQPVYPMVPINTRQEWDNVNLLPYVSDIPQYMFIWNGTMGVWPIPSTTGNIITFNHKTRIPDLTFSDYSTGNISGMTVGSYSVTGTSTAWNATGGYPLNTDLTFLNLFLRVDPPYGDGIWYQIQSFQSDTALTLALPVINAPGITASSTYTIAQLPVLQEDFHDMLVYGALMVYYSTIVKDSERYTAFENLYNSRMILLQDYAGTKQSDVDLEDTPIQLNPNLFYYKQS